MPNSIQAPKSVLMIDISPEEVQAHLVERSNETYHWVGVGRATTALTMAGTVNRKCLAKAIQQLAMTTYHELLGADGEVISPENHQGRGVDHICMTWSLAAHMKAILIGLMPGFSISNGRRLTEDMPLDIIDELSISDGRSEDEKMNALLTNKPDLIVLAGGVEEGAIHGIKKYVDLLVRSFSTLPQELRPTIFYCGNSSITEFVKSTIEPLMSVFIAPNIQPSLSLVDLQPAREILSDICNRMWVKRFKIQIGIRPLSFERIRSTTMATEDFISILALCEKAEHGVLAMCMNGLTTSISASLNGKCASYQYLRTCDDINTGQLAEKFKLEDVASWLPSDIEQYEFTEYLAGESLYPGRMPVTSRNDELRSGIARLAGIHTWHGLTIKEDFPGQLLSKTGEADVDLILISGTRLYQYQNHNMALLVMMDVLQPTGISEVYIDREGMSAGLGATAQIDPRIPLHCILGRSVPKLATIIAPNFKGREDTHILTVGVIGKDRNETVHKIRSGKLISIPLIPDETVELRILTHHGAKLGSRYTWKKAIPVSGSLMGIVIDARGRPLRVRKNTQEQQTWIKHNIEQAQEMAR